MGKKEKNSKTPLGAEPKGSGVYPIKNSHRKHIDEDIMKEYEEGQHE